MRLPITVRHSNLGPILHRFRDITGLCACEPPLSHPNFRGVPVGPDRPCWGQSEQCEHGYLERTAAISY